MIDPIPLRHARFATRVVAVVVGALAGTHLLVAAIWLPETLALSENLGDALVLSFAAAMAIAVSRT